MVEKPPLYIYDIYLEVETHGGHGGIWRPFYLSQKYKLLPKRSFVKSSLIVTLFSLTFDFSSSGSLT